MCGRRSQVAPVEHHLCANHLLHRRGALRVRGGRQYTGQATLVEHHLCAYNLQVGGH